MVCQEYPIPFFKCKDSKQKFSVFKATDLSKPVSSDQWKRQIYNAYHLVKEGYDKWSKIKLFVADINEIEEINVKLKVIEETLTVDTLGVSSIKKTKSQHKRTNLVIGEGNGKDEKLTK